MHTCMQVCPSLRLLGHEEREQMLDLSLKHAPSPPPSPIWWWTLVLDSAEYTDPSVGMEFSVAADSTAVVVNYDISCIRHEHHHSCCCCCGGVVVVIETQM
eukprot:GEZU01018015.1.p1 GENE.GEZU01018015.1~~GEZU01018015.1.p1  ORF type:complete len:101 (+),score=3.45 GEZU01018015.1:56-358(+)